MKSLPLARKVYLTTAALLAFTLVLIIGLTWRSLQHTQIQLHAQTQQALTETILSQLQAQANAYAAKVAAFINEAYRVPLSLAALIEGSTQQAKAPLTRAQLEWIDASVLRQSPQLSSIYTQFEANGFDGQDQQHQGGSSHSSQQGTVELYFTRNPDGSIEQHAANPDDKYLTSVNEFGIRDSEWYLCAKEQLRPCLMEPYLYEISPGYSELMTSLTVPILQQGQFRGLAGADINLPIFQQLTQELSQQLYQGQARVTLISRIGLIIGSSHYGDKLGRPLQEANAELAQQVLTYPLNQPQQLQNHSDYLVLSPISIPAAQAHWRLLVELPKSLALAQATQISTELATATQRVNQQAILAGAAVLILGLLLMAVLLKTITRPLALLNDRLHNLASSEGDLTQVVQIDTHAELISLAQSFNQFLSKLRTLIRGLQQIGRDVHQSAQQTEKIASQTSHNLQHQQQELNSVVTAMNQMTSTALQVADISTAANQQTQSIDRHVQDSRQRLEQAVQEVQHMTTDMGGVKTAIGRVAERSDNISNIVEVIRSIAEQTNLLALNAAIEAARAGEQGRGFAVVADEVRALASKTRHSTDEITHLIEQLQQEVRATQGVIDSGVNRAHTSAEQTNSAYSKLLEVVNASELMRTHIAQVATAAHQQSQVGEEINRNLVTLGDAARDLAELAQQSGQGSRELSQLIQQLDLELRKLRT